MQHSDVMDLLVLEKKLYGKLNETLDLTGQISEAAERRDQVSVQLLVAMRQEPIEHLRQTDQALRHKRATLSENDTARLAELSSGGPPVDEFERMLSQQNASNARLLERVIALDRRVNQRLGGENSYYVQKVSK